MSPVYSLNLSNAGRFLARAPNSGAYRPHGSASMDMVLDQELHQSSGTLFCLSRVLVGAKWSEQLFASVAATGETPFLFFFFFFLIFSEEKLLGRAHHLALF